MKAEIIYEKLWQEASMAFDRNEPKLDAFLTNRQDDRRRSVTLVARPDAGVCERVKQFLDEIAIVAPEQHFYQPQEFHMTVLSVIPGSELWWQEAQRLSDYLAALDEVLEKCPAFSVAFRGVSASPEAVMIQGFPVNNSLAELRNDLREVLAKHGLDKNLDRRYKIATAHLTIVRFYRPMKSWQPLKVLLAANRNRDFGIARFHSVQLVEADWYASADTARRLKEYPLKIPKMQDV